MFDTKVVLPKLPDVELNKITYKWLDIPYAEQSETQKLDIYAPGTEKRYPTIVHFHGGAFAFGTRRDVNLISMLRGINRGYVVVSVEYRMSSEARFPALVYDAKAAIRFLRAHAREYHIDPDRIAVWGPSAGGYLASMVGVTNHNPVFEDLRMGNETYSSEVQAVVDWCGPCGDFCKMDEAVLENGVGNADHNDDDSPESRIMGAPIQSIPELTHLASPYVHVTPNIPPFLIHHGGSDGTVPVQQSRTLAKAIEDIAGKDRVDYTEFPGKGHHGEPWYDEPQMSDRVFDFLDKYLKQKKKNEVKI
ncbi:MAG: alpha/beta hydrolase [Lachnospiraceae bacterium]|nr:alpha/beta hydrolase [Lachnospiraceae bacterium]